MRLIESLNKKKFLLFNIFFTLYIGINLIGGERGLISYLEKRETVKQLNKNKLIAIKQLNEIEVIEELDQKDNNNSDESNQSQIKLDF